MRTPTCLGRRNPHCTARYHGTYPAYRYGCRCPHAREADRIYRKRLREGRHTPPHIDATGTARRIQALNRIGWRLTDLAARLGCTYQNVSLWAHMDNPLVDRTTAARIAALYRELVDVRGPSPRAARLAAAKGWHSPLAWNNIDDPTEQPQLDDTRSLEERRREQRANRARRFRQLMDAGASQHHIRRELGLNSGTHRRLLADYRAQQAPGSGQVAA